MQRPVLVGEYELTLDAKNRVAVPARLRSAFAEGIYLTKEPEPCLGGWSPTSSKRIDEEATRRPGQPRPTRHQALTARNAVLRSSTARGA